MTSTAASKNSGLVAKAKKNWRQRVMNRLIAFVEVKPYTETANQKARGVAMVRRRSIISLNLLWILKVRK